MTRTPIPNCPQSETPIRERAWAEGQIKPSTPPAKENAMSEYSVEEVRETARILNGDVSLASSLMVMKKAACMLTAYAERIKADEGAADYPECSGDPSSCPENEGRGCCKPNPPAQAAQDALDEARDTAITDVFDAEHPCTTAGRVVEGMALVPGEPTDAMCDAGDLPDTATAYDIYKAMIAAAPSSGEKA